MNRVVENISVAFDTVSKQISSKIDKLKFLLQQNAYFKVENVRLIDRFNVRQQTIGTIYLTSTHLIFIDPEGKRETWILHSLISSVEKLPSNPQGYPLKIRTKHFLSAEFTVPKERDGQDLYFTLLQLRPDSYEKLYCFHYQAPSCLEKIWDPFLLSTEYMRMGCPNREWKIEDINSNFDICDTYPPIIYVPVIASKSMLIGSSKFRSRGRLPVLSYLHPNGASITRCSQSLAGFSARCQEDEQLLQCILKTNTHKNSMCVVDTRPRINAVINRATGKGYENEGYYSNIQFKFCAIENIHTMKNSLQKLIEVCELKNPTMNQYLNGLEKTDWLKHIQTILDTSVFIARAIEIENKNVLVHCSDGWDRTAQTCSIASLLLCPYYRSIYGFRTLIEKEWLSFGHKFSDRCGHMANGDIKEQSPIFLQFIECVWQLTQMYPTTFEFNERYLISLHDHASSCQYGTFIGNCEKDRLDLNVKDRTYSFWNYILQNIGDFKNPLFRAQSIYTGEVLLPNITAQSLRFWLAMYHRFDSALLSKENLTDTLTRIIDHTTALNDHARLLEKRIHEMRDMMIVQNNVEDDDDDEQEQRKVSFIEIDSGLSETEQILNTNEERTIHSTNSDSITSKLSSILRPSDSESGFGGDSPNNLQHSTKSLYNNSTENGSLLLERLALELNSVALDWKSLKSPLRCSCSLAFDSTQRKYNCWRCGEIYCPRCIQLNHPLPGLYSNRHAPVCKTCAKSMKSSPSFVDFTTLIKSKSKEVLRMKPSISIDNKTIINNHSLCSNGTLTDTEIDSPSTLKK